VPECATRLFCEEPNITCLILDPKNSTSGSFLRQIKADWQWLSCGLTSLAEQDRMCSARSISFETWEGICPLMGSHCLWSTPLCRKVLNCNTGRYQALCTDTARKVLPRMKGVRAPHTPHSIRGHRPDTCLLPSQSRSRSSSFHSSRTKNIYLPTDSLLGQNPKSQGSGNGFSCGTPSKTTSIVTR